MKMIKMKFGDFEFPVNPQSIVIASKRNMSITPIANGGSDVQNVSQIPVTVSGSGELYGDGAQACCDYLNHLLKEGRQSWLICPFCEPLKAFLTELSFGSDVKKNCIWYKFNFVQSSLDKRELADFGYTYALEGENAFDIAHRAGISVSRLMQLNKFRNVFCISEGDKVILK